MRNSEGFRREYAARINRAMDHVYEHLGEPLRVEDLARAAHFSPFHFSRLFKAMTGETPAEFIARIRLERAAGRLLASPDEPVTNVALRLGFSSSAAFARAFRRRFGMSASQWRSREGQEESKLGEADGMEGKAESENLPYSSSHWEMVSQGNTWRNAMDYTVEVKDMPEYRVAYIRHTGPYNQIGGAFERLFKWAFAHQLVGPDTVSLGVYHDDPSITPEEKLRSDACIVAPESVEGSSEISIKLIPPGRYAVMRVEIPVEEIPQAWNELMAWLPESGYQPDDRPCYEVYLNNPKEHPEGKFIMDICEPVKPL